MACIIYVLSGEKGKEKVVEIKSTTYFFLIPV